MNYKAIYLCLAIASSFFLGTSSLTAEKKVKPSQKSGKLVFNEKIGTLIKGNTTDFEKKHPGYGSSVGYNAPGITLTIYRYNMKLKKIPSDTSSDILTKHFLAVAGEIYIMERRGKYKSVDKIMNNTVNIGNNKKALHAIFEYIQSGNKRRSHIYLWAQNNNFIKIRYTYNIEKKEEAEKNLILILKDLSK